MKVIIIGSGVAGTTAAFKLRTINKNVEIVLIGNTNHTQYSPCSLPYVVEGEVKSFDDIYIFRKEDYEKNNIKLVNAKVVKINKDEKEIELNDKEVLYYDKLVLATGSKPFVPNIKGLSNYNILKTIDDAKLIKESIKNTEMAIVVGSGYIGIETAIALNENKIKTTLLEIKESILPNTFDKNMSKKIYSYLESLGIEIITNNTIKEVEESKEDNIKSKLILENNQEINYDKLILATGMIPNIELANNLNLKINRAILVNEKLQTSNEDIYAIGDCIELKNKITNNNFLSMLGTTAVTTAEIISENINLELLNLSNQKELELKNKTEIENKINIKENTNQLKTDNKQKSSSAEINEITNVSASKIKDLYIASVGITSDKAKKIGLKVYSAIYKGTDIAKYHPGNKEVIVKIISDEKGKILGSQIIGYSNISDKINMVSMAIENNINIEKLSKTETCYNPASASMEHPVIMSAKMLKRKLEILR